MGDGTDLIWPEADFSAVPFEVFTDPDLHQIEQKKIFQGPVWNFLCLDVEIPNPGDFKVVYVGDTAVVVNRGEDGEIYSFVNRCAHRGAMVVRDQFGTTTEHTCVYHRWVYDNEGNLKFVPFLRGIKGKGGMPTDFRREDHGLQKLKVARYLNVVYGSFDPSVEPLEEYLGPRALEFLDRLFEREPEVMGYMRNRFSSNWKCFWENFNDGWHAGLLHQLPVIFGLHRLTQECNLYLDKWGRHAVHYLTQESDTAQEVSEEYEATGLYDAHLKFNDPTLLDERREFVNDEKAISIATMSTFPNALFLQLQNTIMVRQFRPKHVGDFELYWTYIGYKDDDAELRAMRQQQIAWFGPGGYISMEDTEAGSLVQRGIRNEQGTHSYIGMGGVGPIEDQDHMLSEMAIRGSWRYYAHLMGFKAEGGEDLPLPRAAE